MSSHRNARTIALSALVGLALAGCSFHSSSGSGTSQPGYSGSGGGKPIHHSNSSYQSGSGKPVHRSSTSSSDTHMPKATPTNDDPAHRKEPTTEPAHRTKSSAHRDVPTDPAQRTKPTETIPAEGDPPRSNTTDLKAKTKPVDPADNNTLVAPH